MFTSKELAQIIDLLEEKTKAGKINWETESLPAAYRTKISSANVAVFCLKSSYNNDFYLELDNVNYPITSADRKRLIHAIESRPKTNLIKALQEL